MIIIQLKGGLGNQMFQYAFGRYLAQKNNTKLKLDLTYLLDRSPRENFVFRDFDLCIFNIHEDIASPAEIAILTGNYPNRFQRKIFRIKNKLYPVSQIIAEPHFHFFNTAFHAPDNTYLTGYWQSEKYFASIASIIRSEFTFKHTFNRDVQRMETEIYRTNSVCINVRRSDFVGHETHGVCDINYFNHAIEIIKKEISNPFFYIFSDDIVWCKDNFKLSDSQIVTHEYAGNKFESYLHLMSCCKHFIIPNSSFGWWAAWLSINSRKIVITPKQWLKNTSLDTKDIVPAEWIKI